MFGIFKKRINPTGSSNEFWSWFHGKASAYKAFIESEDRDMRLYKKLIAEMNKLDDRISPELTIDNDGTAVLVLSCDGLKEAADRLIAIADEAPEIAGWRVQKFRPPGDEGTTIELPGLTMSAQEVNVLYSLNRDAALVNVALLVPGYQDDDPQYKHMAFLLLDHSIGEFNTMMHVGAIEFNSPERAPANAHLLTLKELRELIEREFYLTNT
jgi:hypothetical protein